MPRKTIEVETVRQAVNTALATDTYNGRAHRLGAASLLEYVLHATGNYKGYSHLSAGQVPHGEKPGIDRSNQIVDENHVAHGVAFPDDSRRYYH